MWATVSALMCLVCPVLLSVYTVLYVLFYEQINGMEWNGIFHSASAYDHEVTVYDIFLFLCIVLLYKYTHLRLRFLSELLNAIRNLTL